MEGEEEKIEKTEYHRRKSSKIETKQNKRNQTKKKKNALEKGDAHFDLKRLNRVFAIRGFSSSQSMVQKIGNASLMRQSSEIALLFIPPAQFRRTSPATAPCGASATRQP